MSWIISKVTLGKLVGGYYCRTQFQNQGHRQCVSAWGRETGLPQTEGQVEIINTLQIKAKVLSKNTEKQNKKNID